MLNMSTILFPILQRQIYKFLPNNERIRSDELFETLIIGHSIGLFVPKGSTDWGFAPIYFIGIVNFSIHKGSDQVLYRYRLREVDSGEQMTDRIEYIFLEVPNSQNPDEGNVTELDHLGYTFGHISEMTERPKWAKGEFYDLLFKSAEICNFAPEEREEYIKDMRTERDIKNQIAFAEAKGEARGEAIGAARAKKETATNLLKMGLAPESISEATGLTIEEIQALQA